MMKFWKITKPDYESDYQDTYINGELNHPFGLPGISCSACGETWSGSRLLPFVCPDSLKTEKSIKNSWPVTIEQFNNLAEKTLGTIKDDQYSNIDCLLPGDTFMQPSYLEIPRVPEEDFLWCSIGSLVVSLRIKDVLIQNAHKYISSLSVLNISTHPSNKSEYRMPDSGEPEDMMKGVAARDVTSMDQYFEINVREEYPFVGCFKCSVCGTCHRTIMDCSRKNIENKIHWKGAPIFKIMGTHHFVITDDLKNKLMPLEPSNINIVPI